MFLKVTNRTAHQVALYHPFGSNILPEIPVLLTGGCEVPGPEAGQCHLPAGQAPALTLLTTLASGSQVTHKDDLYKLSFSGGLPTWAPH